MPISPLNSVISSPVLPLPKTPSFGSSLTGGNGKFDALLKNLVQENMPEIQKNVPFSPPQNQQANSATGVMQKLVGAVTKSEQRLNDLIKLGVSGQQFSAQQLLTMQAGVYKATLAIDVVSKGVEQTTSGLKTLLQSQV